MTMPVKSLLTLAISHNIYLTAEQRKRLAEGDSVAAVGVSTPIWYSKGHTNEPGREVFCNYIIHNHIKADDQIFFKIDGYEFNLPQLPVGFKPPVEVKDEEWIKMDKKEQTAILERYVPVHGKNLFDVKDGGNGKLSFTRLTRARMRGIQTTVYHTVRIADVEELQDSFIS